MAGGSSGSEATAGLKVPAVRADGASVTTPPRSVLHPSALLRDVVAWAASPESLPWRGDMVRAALAPAVVVAAAVAPSRPVPLTAAVLVAGAYLLLVLAGALGRLDSGVRVPAGVLLGLDALHLFWAGHLTSGLGGPVPIVAATAGVCILLRIALLPPVAPPAPGRPPVQPAGAPVSAAGPAVRPCPRCPHRGASRGGGAQRQGLDLVRAEA